MNRLPICTDAGFLWKEQLRSQKSIQLLSNTLNPPHVFQLAVNYRSHSGITNCAQTVVDLMIEFWPHTIDRLRAERADRSGAKPVLVSLAEFDSYFPDGR